MFCLNSVPYVRRAGVVVFCCSLSWSVAPSIHSRKLASSWQRSCVDSARNDLPHGPISLVVERRLPSAFRGPFVWSEGDTDTRQSAVTVQCHVRLRLRGRDPGALGNSPQGRWPSPSIPPRSRTGDVGAGES